MLKRKKGKMRKCKWRRARWRKGEIREAWCLKEERGGGRRCRRESARRNPRRDQIRLLVLFRQK